MTDKRRYLLEIKTEDDANVQNIERLLQDILMRLYDDDGVEGIRVTDKNEVTDETMEELVSIVDSLDSESIRRAIESVRELEEMSEDG